MRAILRAVFAARRNPRPTPAAKLSGFLRALRRVVTGRAPATSASLRNCHRLPNNPPRVDRLQGSWTSPAPFSSEFFSHTEDRSEYFQTRSPISR
jgi:hypothetical protein